MHVWAEDNPHSIHCRGYQHKFLINIWCGIVGNYLIGPFVFPDRLTGAVYTHFLENDLRNGVEPVDQHILVALFSMSLILIDG
jgi:hypothetical protein